MISAPFFSALFFVLLQYREENYSTINFLLIHKIIYNNVKYKLTSKTIRLCSFRLKDDAQLNITIIYADYKKVPLTKSIEYMLFWCWRNINDDDENINHYQQHNCIRNIMIIKLKTQLPASKTFYFTTISTSWNICRTVEVW